MRTTLSVIKADVGSIGGHVAPSKKLLDTISRHVMGGMDGLLTDYYLGATGDDIAILMAHDKGVGNEEVHRLAWDAFNQGRDRDGQGRGALRRRPGPTGRFLQR